MIVIITGVSGAGKTTVGRLLAAHLGWEFFEGDDYHPEANIAKMTVGVPLSDADRQPWLDRLEQLIRQLLREGRSGVLTCSGLKARYRAQLQVDPIRVSVVFLSGNFLQINRRLQQRPDHFMSAKLLHSQFDSLQAPEHVISVSIDQSPEAIVTSIKQQLPMTESHNKPTTLLDGLMFPEAPRWRDGWLWFTDQHARRVLRVNAQGEAELIAEMEDLPGGLGWLPDGRLLVVSMTQRRLLLVTDQGLSEYADLSTLAAFHCNDMVVDRQGRCYVGNFGYDLHAGAEQRETELILVEADRTARAVADGLTFPNGCCITPDQRTLLVAETFASRITAFSLLADGSLGERRVWAELGEAFPDGICLDREGHLWVAAPNLGQIMQMAEGGRVLQRIQLQAAPYACMLGGEDGHTLFITSSESSDPQQAKQLRSGRIEQVSVVASAAETS